MWASRLRCIRSSTSVAGEGIGYIPPGSIALTRRRLLALVGLGLPSAVLTRRAAAQDALPDCTQTATYGSWTVTGTRDSGFVAREVGSAGEVFKVFFDFTTGAFSIRFVDADEAAIARGGESLGTYFYVYDEEFDEATEWFDGEEVRVVNALSDGNDLTVDAIYPDGSVESYNIDSFGFSNALDLEQKLHEDAIALEDAGKCAYPIGVPCFLTTATCGVIGLPDDCFELRALRRFRDRHMSRTAEGRAEIAAYYAQAPAIAARLTAEPGARTLRRLYRTAILPCALLATLGCDRITHRMYRRMMTSLTA